MNGSNKDYLSPNIARWTVDAERMLNHGVLEGTVVGGPVEVALLPGMRPYQIEELEAVDTLPGPRKAVFLPHKAESGAVRFIFSHIEHGTPA